ncbi:hypothetical protein B0H13DRAFT_1886995 [Mycena leptocephala]|nr:hypothetical protein B0H13DRAFT_1886995 [Mycena leptocephala]
MGRMRCRALHKRTLKDERLSKVLSRLVVGACKAVCRWGWCGAWRPREDDAGESGNGKRACSGREGNGAGVHDGETAAKCRATRSGIDEGGASSNSRIRSPDSNVAPVKMSSRREHNTRMAGQAPLRANNEDEEGDGERAGEGVTDMLKHACRAATVEVGARVLVTGAVGRKRLRARGLSSSHEGGGAGLSQSRETTAAVAPSPVRSTRRSNETGWYAEGEQWETQELRVCSGTLGIYRKGTLDSGIGKELRGPGINNRLMRALRMDGRWSGRRRDGKGDRVAVLIGLRINYVFLFSISHLEPMHGPPF